MIELLAEKLEEPRIGVPVEDRSRGDTPPLR
jgi:hypothetical protein